MSPHETRLEIMFLQLLLTDLTWFLIFCLLGIPVMGLSQKLYPPMSQHLPQQLQTDVRTPCIQMLNVQEEGQCS